MLINDILFEPKYSEEALKAAEKWLVDNKTAFAGTANFSKISDDGKVLLSVLKGACHYDIGRDHGETVALVATEISSRSKKGKEFSSLHEPYLKYLLYDSWFGRFIINRDNYEFCRDYGIIVSSDIPQPFMQAIMIMSRGFQELSDNFFEKFNDLTEKGHDKNLVFNLLSTLGSSVKDSSSIEDIKKHVLTKSYGHRVFPLMLEKSIINLVKGDLESVSKCEKNYREFQKRENVLHLFFTKEDLTTFNKTKIGSFAGYSTIIDELFEQKVFQDALKNYRTKEQSGEKYVPPNPFDSKQAAKTLKPKEINYEEFYSFVLPFIISYLEGKISEKS